MRQLGLFGLMVPNEYDGIGLTNTGYARMVEVEIPFFFFPSHEKCELLAL
jgi:hypothetical protein